MVAGFGFLRADDSGFEGDWLTDEAFGEHVVVSLSSLERGVDLLVCQIGRPSNAVWIYKAGKEGAFRFLRQHASLFHDNRLVVSMR